MFHYIIICFIVCFYARSYENKPNEYELECDSDNEFEV